MSRLVILGAGLTAAAAVETARDQGFDGSITLVGDESWPPYERPQLSKDLLQGKDFALRHDAQWYVDHGVDLRLGTAATAIDRERTTVVLADGSELPYDRLLIATGAAPRVPDLPGIDRALVLRTKEDAEALIGRFEPDARLVTIGGGWIGLEVAASARAAGLEVTVLERGEKPLLGVLGPVMADHLAKLHACHGVKVRTGVDAAEVVDGAVRLGTGEEIAADVVVLAIGAVPRDQLAAEAGLEIGEHGGIVTDEHLRTSDPAILAAGDVALARHAELGPLRVEHWDNAIKQGRLAAQELTGGTGSYSWQPYFFTDQFEFSMEYVGHSTPTDEVVVRGSLEKNEFIAYWLRDEHGSMVVAAAMNVGIWDVNDTLRGLVGSTVDPDELTDLRD